MSTQKVIVRGLTFFFSSFLSPSSSMFFLFLSFSFSFLRLPPAFGLFLSQTTAIPLCTFLKIQLNNVLALTVTYTLIFVNVPTSANIQLSWTGTEGSICLLILYDAQQCNGLEQVKLQYLWIRSDLKEICFPLRKSVVTFAKRITKEKGTFIAWELWFQQGLFQVKRNSVVGKQFLRERLTLGSQSNAMHIHWIDGNSPRKAWIFVQPSQKVNMQWAQAMLPNPLLKRNTGSAKRSEPEAVIIYV